MDELRDWLILSRALNWGSILGKKILGIFPSPKKIRELERAQLLHHGFSEKSIQALKFPMETIIEDEMRWAEKSGNGILTFHHSHYPYLLKQIEDPPILLYVSGDISILNIPQIAMVGSRNPTFYGREVAQQFAQELSELGIGITSGLALGIDAASHAGALSAKGLTIGVLGNGLKYIYPLAHQELAKKMVEQGGALISEYPLDTSPRPLYFPLRNRIISGLSLGTLVIEAAVRSGSLITARLASEQGREVFAVPGSLRNPKAAGCHQLISQGAKLVTQVADIMEEIDLQTAPSVKKENNKVVDLSSQAPDNAKCLDNRLLDALGYEATSIDQISIRSGLPASEVASGLLRLELHGYINKASGGYYIRVRF